MIWTLGQSMLNFFAHVQKIVIAQRAKCEPAVEYGTIFTRAIMNLSWSLHMCIAYAKKKWPLFPLLMQWKKCKKSANKKLLFTKHTRICKDPKPKCRFTLWKEGFLFSFSNLFLSFSYFGFYTSLANLLRLYSLYSSCYLSTFNIYTRQMNLKGKGAYILYVTAFQMKSNEVRRSLFFEFSHCLL